MNRILSVSELNRAVHERLSRDPLLARVQVRGEISGFKTYASGHSYFTLKDKDASVSCVRFRQSAAMAPRQMADGMQVVLFARTSLYDKTGRFQLIVEDVQEEGKGDLYQRFLRLKEDLDREGLFAQERKKAIPLIPRRIVAITSAEGAVIQDMIHVLRRRFPGIRLILIPVPVQGAGAEREIAAALELANHLSLGDVIIVGRGGGSIEDLQPFNEELTARAIAASDLPVISAVGHETDYTIADFVADLRAPTPSAAAELAVPVKEDLLIRLDQLSAGLEQSVTSRLDRAMRRVEELAGRPVLTHPAAIMDRQLSRLALTRQRLQSTRDRWMSGEENRLVKLGIRGASALSVHYEKQVSRLDKATGSLKALSPLAVLSRGYSLVTDAEGKAVSRAGRLQRGDPLELIFHDGRVGCQVTRPSREKGEHDHDTE